MFKRIVIGLVFCLFFASNSYADMRSYVWTYEYKTMRKGKWELEHYLTTEIPNLKKTNINTIKQWLELEYGITDNWDISMYQMYKYSNKRAENDGRYDGFKIRTRYRFGKKDQFILDPLIYLEYIRPGNFHKPDVIEAKLVLAKDIKQLNFSYNQIMKRNLENEGKTEHEYAFGARYAFSRWFKLGLESKGNFSKNKYYIGPTIAGSYKSLWASLGTAFGVRKDTSDDVQIRMIVGYLF